MERTLYSSIWSCIGAAPLELLFFLFFDLTAGSTMIYNYNIKKGEKNNLVLVQRLTPSLAMRVKRTKKWKGEFILFLKKTKNTFHYIYFNKTWQQKSSLFLTEKMVQKRGNNTIPPSLPPICRPL